MPEMPALQTAELDGLRLGFYEAGPRTKTPPLVLCHGWPELAFSWRHQIKALSEDLVHITGDLAGLLDRLKIERAIFVGHDWGGGAVWRKAQEHPSRVARVIGSNTPHRARTPVNPVEIYRRRFGDDYYVVQFQQPDREPDRIFAQNAEETFDFFFRGPAPRPSEMPNFAFPQIIAAYDASHDRRPKLLTLEEMAVFVETYRRTGFTGGINWYRNIERNWRRGAELSEIIGAPSLMIMAELDVVLPPSAADGMEARVPDLEAVLIRGSGHWTMQEKPAEVNAAILDWLKRRFAM